MNFVLSRRGFVFAGAALSLAGCATSPVRMAAAPGETWPELETLLAAEPAGEGLTIRVASRGCAAKADFVFRTEHRADHALVAIARRRLETCKGRPGSAVLTFSYDELGVGPGERIVIANPVLSPSG